MGLNPDGMVLPVSAAILEDLTAYRSALEEYSTQTVPFIEWTPTPDGNLAVPNDTAYLYRYIDATRQAEYLLDRIERTVRFALPNELRYLHRFDEAKWRLAAQADMPGRLASLFIQFCVQNGGHLSDRERAEYFPDLPDALVASLEQAVQANGITEAGAGPTPS